MVTNLIRLHHNSDRLQPLYEVNKWLLGIAGTASFLSFCAYMGEIANPVPYNSQPGRVMLGSFALSGVSGIAHWASKSWLRRVDTTIGGRFRDMMYSEVPYLEDRWPLDAPESTASSE